jgi:hypothetical protein
MEQLYNDTNPVYTKKQPEVKAGTHKAGDRWMTDEAVAEIISGVEQPDGDAIHQAEAVRTFAEQYGYFNHYLLEFAHDTGQISRDEATFMQSVPFVPFYRDVGWQNSTILENQHKAKQERREEGKTEEEKEGEGVLRGADLIDKSIRGSFAPIKKDLFGNITKNVNALIRDGMVNVAGTRTMRDELASGTAVEIPTWTRAQQRQLEATQRVLDKKKKAKDEAGVAAYQERVKLLEKQKADIDAEAKEINARLDDENFSTILVKVKGVSTSLEPIRIERIRARLAQESGVDVSEISNEQLQDEIAKGELRADEYTEADPQKPADMLENGIEKTYRVMDPELSSSMMNIGFSPMQSIENFFTTKVKLPPKVSAGIAKILVGSSRVLREAVTRSPPFMIKNIIRDAMQATVVYGGGPKMFFTVLGNVFQSDIVARAEQAGLGIGVDWSPDPNDAGKDIAKILKREQMSWASPKDFVGNVWGALGNMAKRSEVATRMAVYDHAKAQGMSNAEATNQAIEIINYGRRGASPLFAVMTAMAPFMNGRIQGLDVTYRTHMGKTDVPGLYPGSGGGALGLISEEQRMNSQRARALTVLGRGSLIAFGTLMYYMLMRDEEEYKNAREDVKNDWWLIPMGKGRPGVKIPIPFEVGFLYKVIPEQIARVLFEEEHDVRDMRNEVRRQITGSLMMDLRPQAIRPIIDAMRNKDAYQRDDIVPSWMEDTVASTEQWNPYTNMVTRLAADGLDKVPFLNNVGFLTSPMKLEYMMRQYFGTLGSYVMASADAITRKVADENVVGTQADFGQWTNIPGIRDMIFDPRKGGGYQEDFYELVEDIDKLVTTLGQIEGTSDIGRPEREARDRAREYSEEHQEYFQHERRVRHFEREMKHWREDRDRLFNRRDVDNDEKRRILHRMFEQRDDILEEMLQIMGDIRRDRGVIESLLGKRP